MLYSKLKAGTLRDHSEQMNKWTAGFFDADGCVSLHIKKHSNGRYGVYLQVSIAQTKPEILHLLKAHYKIGGISGVSWHLSGTDARRLLNLIGKHLKIKATHADNMQWVVDELQGLSIKDPSDLKEYAECSRKNSRWRTEPKHIPLAYMAGYFDGDGHYLCRVGRIRRFEDGRVRKDNLLKLFVGCARWDSFLLDKLHQDYGGSIALRKDGCYFWQLALGKSSRSLAMKLLPKLRKYSCLPDKFKVIDRMIAFHTTRRD